MRSLRLIAALAILLPLPAEAHRAWMLPSSTILSGEDGWATFDTAVSNDLFVFEHVPMRLDGLIVTGPDGNAVKAENATTGKFRSSFDLHLVRAGTYRASVANEFLFANYKLNGETKRWRGRVENFEREIPREAQDLKLTQSFQRTETFVTLGKPNTAALAPTGKGLELRADTHPNNLAAGETARFTLLLDGVPAPGIEVEIVRGGARYRDKPGEMRMKSGSDGSIAVTWPEAGMYWLGAEMQDDKASLPKARRRATYNATFEVLPQ
ncbi:DUF4198 domain-containing protein [Methylobacterium soli]|uniref:DUF4198 domain-containing protein n=1 Tax=Methylobacterium soli TaxID=553447 RepID=A0A6L3SXJ8_9HYPH|nr:DUF4198 domain-containing protein [Methylobacterium soli]KAB1078549.1 DUF4198 domain-containing protein [Methylobacterium soli]GJE44379.1 hypothetical protein AEGHOMDF_3567 [Methylobacterium soli]